jgi:hypothetical protein
MLSANTQTVLVPPPANLGSAAWTLTHGAEYYNSFITAAFQKYLGRTPDQGGLAYWRAAMQGGLSDEHLEAGFIGSALQLRSP